MRRLHDIPNLEHITVYGDIELVPMQNSHADRLLEILKNDPSIRSRVTVASRLFTTKDVAHEVQSYMQDDNLIRYVILRNNQPIGLVSLWRDTGFFNVPAHQDDYGFGYFIDPNERGKGIVVSAVRALIEQVNKALYVRQFVAFCEDDNLASLGVLTKLGFKKESDKTYQEPTHEWLEKKYILPVNGTR